MNKKIFFSKKGLHYVPRQLCSIIYIGTDFVSQNMDGLSEII